MAANYECIGPFCWANGEYHMDACKVYNVRKQREARAAKWRVFFDGKFWCAKSPTATFRYLGWHEAMFVAHAR